MSTKALTSSFCEWVRDHAVPGLERSNFGLEGAIVNGTDHLQGNVWAVEESAVIRGSTLITNNVVVVGTDVKTE